MYTVMDVYISEKTTNSGSVQRPRFVFPIRAKARFVVTMQKQSTSRLSFRDPIPGFATLNAAVIDASSIIYMHKAGFLHRAAGAVTLHSPRSVIDETGLTDCAIQAHPADIHLVPDRQLIALAHTLTLPVISEDKGVLMVAAGRGFAFYNALMILNMLLYRKAVDEKAFYELRNRLLSCARYGEAVVAYGETVTQKILLHKH